MWVDVGMWIDVEMWIVVGMWIDGLMVFEEDGEDEMTVCEGGRKGLGRFDL